MTAAPLNTPRRPLPVQAADLRGLARLGVDAVVGVADVVEAMHHTILSRPGITGPASTGRTGGLTGLIYRSVRGTTRVVGKGLDAVLGRLPAAAQAQRQPQREAWLAALNGVWGDHLLETGNPLAIAMRLRHQGRALDLNGAPLDTQMASASGRIVVLLHGLCMNDLQWSRQGHDHGAMLAREIGYTPIHLHYNSGRHVSHNGQEFAALLGQLVAAWPVPVEELVIVGHSMGGLVARSACHQAQGQPWLDKLTRLVFLGTPHHGAPLERGGRMIDVMFGISPYGAPLARLGKARSQGITDLRYGNLQQADWHAGGRHAQRHDDRHPTPLPAGVQVFVAAALIGKRTGERVGSMRDKLVGDGLVPLASALGQHRNPALALNVPHGRQLVVTSANHWDLLSRPEVAAKLLEWLA